MEEDISIINNNTRNEKIKNFFIKNKKILISSISFVVIMIFGFFIYQDLENKNKIKLAEKYNLASMNFNSGNTKNVQISSRNQPNYQNKRNKNDKKTLMGHTIF